MTAHRLALLRLALLIALTGGAFAAVALTGPLSIERARSFGDEGGVTGVVVFVALSSALTVALFPGPLLSGASGLLFGTALGTPVSIVSATLGAVLAASLSRHLGAQPFETIGGPRMLAARDWVGRRGFTGVLLLRLAPGLPYTLVNYGVGLTRIPLVIFAAGTAIGCAPRAFAYTALGGQFGDFGSWETLVALVALVGTAALGVVLAARDEELRAAAARARIRRAS